MTNIKFLTFCATAILLASFPANAEKITKEAIEKHLQAMADLYNVTPVDNDKIYKFIDNYALDDAPYKANIFVNGNNIPVVEEKSKRDTLKELRENPNKYLESKAKVEVINYRETTNESISVAQYKLYLDATVEKQVSPTQTGKISFSSVSDCLEKFKIENGQIKGLENICDIKLNQSSEPVITVTPKAAQ